jgi:hypothetical protein
MPDQRNGRTPRSRLLVRVRRPAVLQQELNVRTQVLWLAVGVWASFYLLIAINGGAGFDSHAYWLTRQGVHYLADPGKQDAYLYSPAFAHAVRLMTLLPWAAFALIWLSLASFTYLWLARAVDPRWRIPLLALCLGDVIYGNVWWLFAITLALGLRRPALWAIPALLKVTPAVGLIWFGVRREWRNLVVAVTVAAAVAAFSFCLAPSAWIDWIAFLRNGHQSWFADKPLPLPARLIGGFALTVYAARTDRPCLLPLALWLTSPVFSLNGIAVFAVLPYLATNSQSLRADPVVDLAVPGVMRSGAAS